MNHDFNDINLQQQNMGVPNQIMFFLVIIR